jgi:AP-1-like factor
MVDQDHVDAALRKLGKKDEQGNPQNPFAGGHQLMFEQESWDKVLKKMNNAAGMPQ